MKIALRSMANHKLVCAEGAGNQPLIANRDAIGDWEKFELIIVDGEDPLPLAQPPPSVDQPPFAAFPAVDYVAKVKSWLLGQGKDLSGPCGAFLITSWVIWGLRDRGAGSLFKPSGNNCRERATDIVMFSNEDGAIVDILSDAGNTNGPTWLRSGPGEVDAGRWRPPEYPG